MGDQNNNASASPAMEVLEARVLYSADSLLLSPPDEPLLADESLYAELNPNVLAPDASVAAVADATPAIFSDDALLASDQALLSDVLAPYTTDHADRSTSAAVSASADSAHSDEGITGLLRTIQSTAANQAPVLTGLPTDPPVFTETSVPVLLAPSLVVSDPDLDVSDNYDGFEVWVERTNDASATDHFHLGDMVSGNSLTDGAGGVVTGEVVQNSNGSLQLRFNAQATQDIVQNSLRAISYSNSAVSDEHSSVELLWTLNDQNSGSQGTGGALISNYQSGVHIVPAFNVAVDDDLGTRVAGTPFTINESDLLDNDTGLRASEVIDVTAPSVGALGSALASASGNILTYTSAADDTGPVSFDYTSMAGNSSLVSQWPLDAGGTDNTGSNSGTLHSDSDPDALVFDGDDYVELPDIEYPDAFVLTFDFKINNFNNDLEEVFFSHGEYRESHSLLVWATGTNYVDASDRGKLFTYIRDGNDPDNTFGLGIDVTAFNNDNEWHNYAAVVQSGVGIKVFIDGVEKADASRGDSALNPNLPAYIGTEYDNGSLVYHLTNHEMADLRLLSGYDGTLNEFSSATATFDLRNEEVLAENNRISVDEDSTVQISDADLLATDVDNSAAELVYELTAPPAFGKVLLGSTELGVGDSFTQLDINSDDVSFRHGGDETAISDSIGLRVDDGEGSHTALSFELTLNPINDAPALTDGSLASVSEDTDPPGALISTIFDFTGADVDGNVVGVAVAGNTDRSHGEWQYRADGVASWTDIGDVTESGALMLELSASLRFAPALNYHGTAPSLVIYAVDNTYAEPFTDVAGDEYDSVAVRGGSTPFSGASASVNSTVVSVNDAPTAANVSIDAVSEDSTDPPGNRISDVFNGAYADADVGGSMSGIAVVANAATNAEGTWQYSTDSGSNWYGIGTVSETNALLLNVAAMLRFVPASNYDGSVTPLQVHVLDDSESRTYTLDDNRQPDNVTTRGGATSIAADSADISVVIHPLFDAPYFSGSLPAAITATEDSTSTIDLSGLEVFAGDWAGNITLHLYTASGGQLTALDENDVLVSNHELFITVADVNVLNLLLQNHTLEYQHPTDNLNGAAVDALSVRLIFGGSYSSGLTSTNIDIASVNDLPVVIGYQGAPFTLNEDETLQVTASDLAANIGVTDVEDAGLSSFVVTAKHSGELMLGENESDATPYVAGDNDTIDADTHAWWRPDSDDNGEINAFAVAALDSDGGQSTGSVDIPVSVVSINDPPVLDGYDNAIISGVEDTVVEISIDALQALSSDVEDTTVSAMQIESISATTGSLFIGPDLSSLQEFEVGVNDIVDSSDKAYWTPASNQHGVLEAFTVRGVDTSGAKSVDTAIVRANIASVNDAPIMNTLPGAAFSAIEDSTVTLTLDSLAAVGSDTEDGALSALVVQGPASDIVGSLRIGTGGDYEPGVNDTIDADNPAYWTPPPNANGTIDAFAVKGLDVEALESVDAVMLRADVTAVNDAPTLTANSSPYPLVDEDQMIAFDLAELVSLLDAQDIDGAVDSVVIDSVAIPHTLKIGPDAGLAADFEAGVNDTVNASNHLYWFPAPDDSDFSVEAFIVRVIDEEGLESTQSVPVSIEIQAVNDAPTITAVTEPYPVVREDGTLELTFDVLKDIVSAQDIDSVVTSMVIESVADNLTQSLRVGTNNVDATEFLAGSNDTVDAANSIYWTPAQDYNGIATDVLTLRAVDDAGLSSVNTVAISAEVLAVNDAPSAVNNTLVVEGGTVTELAASYFGISDPVESHGLLSVDIISLPTSGQLLLLETPVSAGQTIDVTALQAGLLSYVSPFITDGESDRTTIEFAVRDDGGVDNGGVDLSVNTALLHLNIIEADLPPVAVTESVLPFQVVENSPAGTTVGVLSAIDPDPVFSHLTDVGFMSAVRPEADVTRYAADGTFFGAQIGSWTVVSGDVDLRGELWERGPDGGYALDLNGRTTGVIEQQIVTQPGAPYTLNFALAGNFRAHDTSAVLDVAVADQTTEFTVDKHSDWSEANLQWQQHSIRFIAADTTTTIRFESRDDGFFGPVVTDITVYDEVDFALSAPTGAEGPFPFAIGADNTLVVTDAELDYESSESYTLPVVASELNGLSSSFSIPVEVIDVNESPVLISNERLQVIVDTPVIISQELLDAFDQDGADQPSDARIYTLLNNTGTGQLLLGGTELAEGDQFTQADINNGALTFVASMSGDDHFAFRLSDGGEDGAAFVEDRFDISVYESLQLNIGQPWLLNEGHTMVLSTQHLTTSGGFYSNEAIRFELSGLPATVRVVDSESGADMPVFGQQMLLDGRVALLHDGTEPGAEPQPLSLMLQRLVDDQWLDVESTRVGLSLVDIATAPAGVDSEMATDHITELSISLEQLGFDDGTDGDTLSAITFEQVPAAGELLNGDTVLQTGAVIEVNRIQQLFYRPDPATVGNLTESIVFRLHDDGDVSSGGVNISADTNTITINVTSDHKPVAVNDTVNVHEGGLVTVLESGAESVLDNDVDLDTETKNLRAVLVDAPQHGTLELREDGTFEYRHDRSETVSDRFSYRVLENDAASVNANNGTNAEDALDNLAWVEVVITPVDDGPIASDIDDQTAIAGRYFEFTIPENTFQSFYPDVSLTLTASLTNGEVLPDWLEFDAATGTFSGVPNINITDALQLRVTATDTYQAEVSTEFTLQLEPALAAALPAETDLFARTAVPAESVSDERDERIAATTATGDSAAVSTAQSGGRESIADMREEDTTKAIRVDTDAAADERFVTYTTAMFRPNEISFEDKIIKHIVRDESLEALTSDPIVIDPLNTVSLQQLYFAMDDYQLQAARKILDQMEDNRTELAAAVETDKVVFGGVTTVSVGLSISYVLWLMKSGVLLSSALSAMPAWRLIDPVPVLQENGADGGGEDESLESMVEDNDNEPADAAQESKPNAKDDTERKRRNT